MRPRLVQVLEVVAVAVLVARVRGAQGDGAAGAASSRAADGVLSAQWLGLLGDGFVSRMGSSTALGGYA